MSTLSFYIVSFVFTYPLLPFLLSGFGIAIFLSKQKNRCVVENPNTHLSFLNNINIRFASLSILFINCLCQRILFSALVVFFVRPAPEAA